MLGVVEASGGFTEPARSIPVLMYHRIYDSGPPQLERWRVTPQRFGAQLRYLREHGFYTVTSDDVVRLLQSRRAPSGRPVMLTFDDGYCDFAQNAWPLLRAQGFRAEVFLVTGLVGQVAAWDARFGRPATLMDWREIRALAREGVKFGSHLVTHRPATRLSTPELFAEAVQSRTAIEAHIGTAVRSLAMPFGRYDDRLFEILEKTGYECAYTTEDGSVTIGAHAFRLPRIHITDEMELCDFAARLATA